MQKSRLTGQLVLIINLCLVAVDSNGQTDCQCNDMLVTVFREDFSNPSMPVHSNVWDLDIQTHSRVWNNAPEQQYYVNTWHTWWNPEELTEFTYSSEANSDVMILKVKDEPIRQSDVPLGENHVVKVEDTFDPGLLMTDGFPNARDFRLRSRAFMSLRRFRYGVYKMRSKFPSEQALWPAFWLFKSHDPNGNHAEIDIIEFESDKPNMVPTNAHIGDPVEHFHELIPIQENLASGFHDIVLIWLPVSESEDCLAWFVDNNQSSIRSINVPRVDNTMEIIFNFAVGGSPFTNLYDDIHPNQPRSLDAVIDNMTFPLEWVIDEISVDEIFQCGTNTYDSYQGHMKDDPVVTGNILVLGGENTSNMFLVPGSYNGGHRGKHVDAVATKEIILKNGFHAEQGSNFHARTVECVQGSNRLANPGDDVQDKGYQIARQVQQELYKEGSNSGKRNSKTENGNNPPTYSISPNPNSGTFTIAGSSLHQVIITDASGKLVRQVNGGMRTQVQIDGLSSGLYLVRAQMADGSVENGKVIVN